MAEWRGFLAALDAALARGAQDVEVRADSQLVLKQFTGEYKMKAPHLAQYLTDARKKAKGIARIKVTHVPREKNKHADALANLALDAKKDVPTATKAPPKVSRGQGSLFD